MLAMISIIGLVLFALCLLFLIKLYDTAKSIESAAVWLINDRDWWNQKTKTLDRPPSFVQPEASGVNSPMGEKTPPVQSEEQIEQELLAAMNENELAIWTVHKQGRESLYPDKVIRLTPYLASQIRRIAMREALRQSPEPEPGKAEGPESWT